VRRLCSAAALSRRGISQVFHSSAFFAIRYEFRCGGKEREGWGQHNFLYLPGDRRVFRNEVRNISKSACLPHGLDVPFCTSVHEEHIKIADSKTPAHKKTILPLRKRNSSKACVHCCHVRGTGQSVQVLDRRLGVGGVVRVQCWKGCTCIRTLFAPVSCLLRVIIILSRFMNSSEPVSRGYKSIVGYCSWLKEISTHLNSAIIG
jgi:hypothetical protein